MKHYLVCPAPICNDKRAYKDQPNWESEIIWYPGEEICKRSPYTSWQKKQLRINKFLKEGSLKFPDRYFTVSMLNGKQFIRSGIKGGDADRKVFYR